MAAPLIQIPIEPESAPFFDACERGELSIQGCTSCGRLRFPARPVCPWCHSTASEWRLVSGRGRIWSFAVPHPPLLPPFQGRAPYNVAVVELDEDPLIRVVGNVVVDAESPDLEFVDPSGLDIGARVDAVFPKVDGEPRLLRWVLAQE
jgi:uncharacterized OB-fold protein